jgi:hypothetical protein
MYPLSLVIDKEIRYVSRKQGSNEKGMAEEEFCRAKPRVSPCETNGLPKRSVNMF